MDKLFGVTIEVTLGGEAYTASETTVENLGEAKRFFLQKRIAEFVALAEETAMRKDVYLEELDVLMEPMSDAKFIKMYDGVSEVGIHLFFLNLKTYQPTLTREQFDAFPWAEKEAAIDALQNHCAMKEEKKKEDMKKAKTKKKAT